MGRSRGEEEEEEGGEMASDPWKKQYLAMLQKKRKGRSQNILDKTSEREKKTHKSAYESEGRLTSF